MKSLLDYKKNFYRDGFVKIEKLFNKREIMTILDEIDKIKKRFKKIKNPNLHYTSDNKINTIHDINKFVKNGFLNKLSKDNRIIKITRTILDDKPRLRNLEFFLKPKRTGRKAPIHQDNFYWNIPSKKALNIWIACTKSDSKNGGIFYFIKSHKGGLVDHELSYQPGTSQKISSKYIDKMKYKKKYPTLKPGDVIFHHCEVIHGSNKNYSNNDRVGLVMSFKGIKAKVDIKRWNKYQKNLKLNLNHLAQAN